MTLDDPHGVALELLTTAGRLGAVFRPRTDEQALRALAEAGRRGLSQSALAVEVGATPATISRLIDVLEGRGLVLRNPNPLDRRSKMISITASGREYVSSACERMKARSDRVLASLSLEDVSTLNRILSRVLDRLPTS